MRRLILVLLGALGLGDTAELLGTVLPLLACRRERGLAKKKKDICFLRLIIAKTRKEKHTLLAGSLLDLAGGTDTDETVVGLELLEGLGGVVDQSKAGALTTTVLCAETEDGDLVLVGLVQVGQLLTELVLGDVGAVGVEDVPRYSRKDVRSMFSGFSMLVSVCVLRVPIVFVLLFLVLGDCRISMLRACDAFPTHRSKTRGKIRGVLTRPSACGQAEGCG